MTWASFLSQKLSEHLDCLFRKDPLLQDGRVPAQEPSAQTAHGAESSRDSSGKRGLGLPGSPSCSLG